MKSFNLLVSTSRYNEKNAKTELWFTLLMCGDKYPIISNLEYSGLIIALSNLETREIILRIKEILERDRNFFRFILKIIPIDVICETNLQIIKKTVEENYRDYIKEGESFKINLKRRKNEQIGRDQLIGAVAKKINNKVDLENPDKIILINLLGYTCSISFLENGDILRVKGKLKNF